jgi:hypothetical protein
MTKLSEPAHQRRSGGADRGNGYEGRQGQIDETVTLAICHFSTNHAAYDKLRFTTLRNNETPRAALNRSLGVLFLHQKL